MTVSDVNACSAVRNFTITQSPQITIAVSKNDVRCNGASTGSINLIVNGGDGNYQYSWSNGLASVRDQNNLAAGTYSVTVTDGLGCIQTGSVEITQPSSLSVTSGVVSNANCFGSDDGNINISIIGGVSPYTYAWSNGQSVEDASGLTPGSYTVTVTDFNLCSTTASYSITEPDSLVITNVMITPNCASQSNGIVSFTVSGGTGPYTYAWTGSGVGSNPRLNMSGVSSVTVTDARGCTVGQSFDLIPLTLEVVGIEVTCFGNDGVAIANVMGGTEPYTYAWSNGGNTERLEGINVGTYSVTVTSGSCTASGTVVISVPSNCAPPTAQDETFTTTINVPISNTVMPTNPLTPGYDSDPVFALSELIFEDITNAPDSVGIMEWDSINRGSFTFTPGTNFVGSFTWQYLVCNPLGLCDTAAVTINVDPLLILANDDMAPSVNGYTGNNNVINAYSNDSFNGLPLNLGEITGTVLIGATPKFVGAPIPSMNAGTGIVSVPAGTPQDTYTITYRICENLIPTNCDTAVVTVAVGAAPIDAVADNFGPINGSTGSTNAGNAYTNDLLNGSAVVVSQITGMVVIPAVPAFSGAPVPSMNVATGIVSVPAGTPPANYTITYEICENLNPTSCDQAVITVQVSNTPPVAVNDSYNTNRNQSVVITPLTNDSDPDNHPINFTSLNGVSRLVGQAQTISVPNGSLQITAGGVITFVPNTGYVGTVTFPYVINDGNGGTSSAQVTIDVLFVNDPPTIAQPPVTTPENTPVTFCPTLADPNVGDVLTLTICGGPTNGTASVNPSTKCVTYTPNNGYFGPDQLCLQVCDQEGLCATTNVPIDVVGTFVRLNAKVLLQGSLINNTSEMMRDSLRKTTNFPMTSPYGTGRYTRVANTAETMPSTAMLADYGANSIVDWVFVELRSATNPATVVATRSGLLQRDGDIVDVDGVSPLTFSSTINGNYYVAVRHRNHLGTMTAQPIALTAEGTTVDFTDTNLDLYNRTTNFNGFEQATVGTRRALWLGDTNVDGRVIFSGQNTDKTDVFNAIDQAPLNPLKSQAYVLRGYGFGDVNLDGRTIFAGQNNDITPIFNVVDSFPLNATFRLQSYVIVEQLP